MNLIELNDHRLILRNEQGVLAESPGFANIAGNEPVFGEAARRMARLYPREHFSQFWHQLSLDPLSIKTRYFRHHADIAYQQLKLLCAGLSPGDKVLVAAPANYNRAQLGVLLGLLNQTGLQVEGLVDHMLLQAAGTGADDCLVLDLQLHQAVLASYRKVEDSFVRDRVLQIPGAGLLALQDAWSGAVIEAFLQQSRFDPTHSAETEQYIANQLDHWLQASSAQRELLLEINLAGSVHQARLNQDQLVQRSRSLFARIAEELPQLQTGRSSLHAPAALLALPGFTAVFPGVSAIAEEAALANALHHQRALVRSPQALGFITRLPLDTAQSMVATAPARQPSHVLYQHQAIALPLGRLALGTPPELLECARVLSVPGLAGGIVLNRTMRGVTVEVHGQQRLRCNNEPAVSGQSLKLGDVLQIDNHDAVLQLILVE